MRNGAVGSKPQYNHCSLFFRQNMNVMFLAQGKIISLKHYEVCRNFFSNNYLSSDNL